MTSEPVTRDELAAHIEPMKRGIERIEEVVVDIPLIRAQVEATNGEVAKHTREIGEINKWRYMLSGGCTVVALIIGGGGITYGLTMLL